MDGSSQPGTGVDIRRHRAQVFVRPDGDADSVESMGFGTYLPGLDGVRAISMIALLAYHARFTWARGAFLAVSQFFTLSGFLITGVLLRSHLVAGGRLRAFWVRRFRRLAPAALLALALVIAFGATAGTRQQIEDLPAQVLTAGTWTANWHFVAGGTSYVDLFAAPSPVQHFWSLAVEEQFYIVLPFLLLAAIRIARANTALLAGILAVVAALSSGWMAFLHRSGVDVDRLYYGTDTRLAEMMVGALMGVIVFRRGLELSDRARSMLSVLGGAALAITFWGWGTVTFADRWLWEGGFLVFSVMSCAVILGALAGKGPIGTLLTRGPLPQIGRITYGLYLFHWPIYLWLTEERTGLDRWPLLGIRVALTFAVAMLSYRFVEQPILRAEPVLGFPAVVRIAVAPIALAALVVASLLIVDPEAADDPLATLRSDQSAIATPPNVGDAALDVLVIPGRSDDPVIAALAAQSAREHTLALTVTEPFVCTTPTVETAHGRTCGNWVRTWRATIDEVDPDVVLFYVDDWAGTSLADLTREIGRRDEVATAVEILSAGLGILTDRGAPVVWASSGTDFAGGFRRSQEPLHQAIARLETQRDDFFKVIGGRLPVADTLSSDEHATRTAALLLEDVALYGQERSADQLRVMVVGDSQARSLGYGLERWGAEEGRALVWNLGTEGCGLANKGESPAFGSTASGQERCRDVIASWPRHIASFDPDVVVVFTSLFDISERRLEAWPEFKSLGDPEFDAFLRSEYSSAIETLSSRGAQVVWMRAPCTERSSMSSGKTPSGATDAVTLAHYNEQILVPLAREHADRMRLFPLDDVICPDGQFLERVEEVNDLRPDGVHFSVEGALWFADSYGEELLALERP